MKKTIELMLIELGFRKPYDKWFLLASSQISLGKRLDNTNETYLDDSWFYSNSNTEETENIHERIYQLSKPLSIGGSDKIQEN